MPFNNQRVGSIDFFVGAGNNQDGVIGKSRNNGKSWEMSTLNFQIINLHFNDSLNGIVVGAYGNIYKTKDGGKSWSLITKALGDIYGIDKIELTDRYILHICGTNGLVGSSSDSGSTWSFKYMSNMGNLKSITFDGMGTEWVCNDAGQIYRSVDTGKSWVLNFSNSFEDFGHFGKDNQGRIWVCGDLGRLDLNEDTTWNTYTNMPGNHDLTFDYITDFVFIGNNIGWFCTNEGNLFSNSKIDTVNSSLLNVLNFGNSFQIYQSQNTLIVKNFESSILNVTIFNSEGKFINEIQIEGHETFKETIDSNLASGVYLLSVESLNWRTIEKLVIYQ